ncbi:unnamed protein product, partial [Didymodactylos carnosus]
MRLLLRDNQKKDTQKIVVGESNGTVQLFSIKKKEAAPSFKTPPGKRIRRVELGGKPGEVSDRIFVAADSEVRGYTKKGKQFYAFDTNVVVPIQSMSIFGSNLYSCTDTTYTHYVESKEVDTLTLTAKINDIIILPTVIQPVPVLACQDRLLRIINKSSVSYETELPEDSTIKIFLCTFAGPTKTELIYGTSDGRLGQLEIGSLNASSKWEIANPKHLSAVSAIDFYDIIGDGVPDMIVSREDGAIEVYNFETAADEPLLKYSYNGSESITNIEGGVVGNPDYEELVCCTYQGWLFGMTSEPLQNELGGEVVLGKDDDLKQKIDDLKQEVDELQRQLAKTRERYQDTIKQNSKALSTVREFRVTDRFELNRDDATYNLALESELPIDNVLLQCDVILDILNVEKNSAVMSFSACDPKDNNAVLVTYRCQANTTRLEMHIRTIEGHYGTLQLYITSKIQPKCSMLKRHIIKPLSLHQRSNQPIDNTKKMNTMKIVGSFSYAEVHSWIQFCLSDVPERPPVDKENRLAYTNIFLQTQLELETKTTDEIINFSKWSQYYKNLLLNNVIPFWIKYSIDEEYGGYFTCINRDGQVFDKDKFIWLQARQVWMFAKLYQDKDIDDKNLKSKWLDVALHGANFLEKYGRNLQNQQWYFSLTQDGQPLIETYNIFSSVFASMAFGQLAKIYSDINDDNEKFQHYKRIALDTFHDIEQRRSNPKGLFEKSCLTSPRKLKSFALPMMLCNLAMELEHIIDKEKIVDLTKQCINEIINEFRQNDSGLILEYINADGSGQCDSFEGRLINPGHGIEAMWFLLDIAEQQNNSELSKICIDTTLKILDYSWDKQYNGIYY